MSNKRQVGEAVDIARSIVGDEIPAGPPLPALTEFARRFAATEFDVPDDQDADGFLFQYGEASWFPEPTFVVSMVRQLEVVDRNGEHESYAQVESVSRSPIGDLLGAKKPREFLVWIDQS